MLIEKVKDFLFKVSSCNYKQTLGHTNLIPSSMDRPHVFFWDHNFFFLQKKNRRILFSTSKSIERPVF